MGYQRIVDDDYFPGVYRSGNAIIEEKPDGTKTYTLTKNKFGYMSNVDGTYFPEERSSITITPQGDTTGRYEKYVQDALPKIVNYVTKTASDNYKLSHGFWGLRPSKTNVIPEFWWNKFDENFGLKRK